MAIIFPIGLTVGCEELRTNHKVTNARSETENENCHCTREKNEYYIYDK